MFFPSLQIDQFLIFAEGMDCHGFGRGRRAAHTPLLHPLQLRIPRSWTVGMRSFAPNGHLPYTFVHGSFAQKPEVKTDRDLMGRSCGAVVSAAEAPRPRLTIHRLLLSRHNFPTPHTPKEIIRAQPWIFKKHFLWPQKISLEDKKNPEIATKILRKWISFFVWADASHPPG